MRSYVCIFALALLVAAILTPLVRWFCFRIGAVTTPRARDIHQCAVPRLGGVAIAAACFVPFLALQFIDSGVAHKFREHPRLALGLLVGGVVLGGLGVADDTRGVSARAKLLVQVVVAVFAYAVGFRIEAVYVPLFGVWQMGVFALPATVLWIVGIINAVNLIDGLDGLAAGVIFFAALTNFVVAVVAHQIFVALIMSSIMGAMVGFLFYNFNPARIFMGDSGSYFLGYLLATASLTGSLQKASTGVSLLVPMVAMGIPIFDTLFSIVRRTLERRPLFSADRGHVHHRLLDMGLTHRRAVMVLYGVSILLTVSAIAIALGRRWEIGLALLVASVVLTALIRFVGYFEYVRLRRALPIRTYDRQTLALKPLVPRVAVEIAAATSEEQLWISLSGFARAAELAVLTLKLGWESQSRSWQSEPEASPAYDVVLVRFPLAAPESFLEFGWISETGRVAPESDLLLHLVSDSVDSALGGLTHGHLTSSAVAPRTRGPVLQPSAARQLSISR
jgi:UDP-GlcNAc:undecaprenyl-phosphate/decaprenyl-phosphate GlcNAc-1-phosphate transferase